MARIGSAETAVSLVSARFFFTKCRTDTTVFKRARLTL